MDDTIFAQATAKGRGGIAVIRVSGQLAFSAVEILTGPRPLDRVASLRRLVSPDGDFIDESLVICFPGPGSFTGEDTVEFQVHGSLAVCEAVLAALAIMPGLRLATAGEFTRRALMNGRLDLAQVEGLGDLIVAETTAQRRLALRMMDGALSRTAFEWRSTLLKSLAFVEASIDFADEDLPVDLLRAIAPDLGSVHDAMRREITGGRISERLREGFQVALVGRPNVGKSTLLNAIAGRDAAIVSTVAGTTRDIIEVRMDLQGLPVTFLDTAGVREAQDEIERLGVARTVQRARSADIRVFLIDDLKELVCLGVEREADDVVAFCKSDLHERPDSFGISGMTGEGVQDLLDKIYQVLSARAAAAGTASHARQISAIGDAAQYVGRAFAELKSQNPRVEIVATELRGALGALDFLVGKVDLEAVLDVIFSSFCLGK